MNSNYNSLQASVEKSLSHGLSIRAAYTYSHALDNGSSLEGGGTNGLIVPSNFKLTYGNSILVGNFGSGKIAAFNGFTGKFIALLKNPDNTDMIIDGLWMIAFGNNANAGPSTTLFFTAGIQAESHGHFGTITPVDGMDGNEDKLTFFSNYNIIVQVYV